MEKLSLKLPKIPYKLGYIPGSKVMLTTDLFIL